MGIPCSHELLNKLQMVEPLLITDIHPQWVVNYIMPDPGTITAVNSLPPASYAPVITLLNPGAIKPKGRPRGALGARNRSTQRDPSLFEHVAHAQSSQRNCGICARPGHNRRNCPNKDSPTPIAGSSSQVVQSEADFLTYYEERFPASQDVDLNPADHPAEGLDLREDVEQVLRGLGIFPAQEE
jgi:hypothetical protein